MTINDIEEDIEEVDEVLYDYTVHLMGGQVVDVVDVYGIEVDEGMVYFSDSEEVAMLLVPQINILYVERK